MHNKHIVIIGNGIASKCVVFELNKLGFDNITVIASDSYAPMCSTRTTAINCLRGTERGNSELGDKIIDSFEIFEDFYHNYKPLGVSKTFEMHTTPVAPDECITKWKRRYKTYDKGSEFSVFKNPLNTDLFYIENKAYIISPEIYFDWFDTKNKFTLINDHVTKIENMNIFTSSGLAIEADELIICTSYMSPDFSKLVEDEKLKHRLLHSKPVAGSYLKFNIEDFDSNELDLTSTYCFRVDEVHLIIRPDSKDVLIGSTSTNNSIEMNGDKEGMLNQYIKLSKILDGVVVLPHFDKSEIITGIRHKGQKRTPYWGEIAKNKYAVWGLYKNAFTFSNMAAKDLVKLIQE